MRQQVVAQERRAPTWAPMSPPVGVLFVEDEVGMDDLQHGERRAADEDQRREVRGRSARWSTASRASCVGRRTIRRPIAADEATGSGAVGSLVAGAALIGGSSITGHGRHCFIRRDRQHRHLPGHEDQPGGVEGHVRDDAHPQPAGAQRAHTEHQTEDEQAGELDPAEVDQGEERGDEHHADRVVEPAHEGALQQAAVHQLLDDRRADHDDEHEDQSQPPCARS